ncbi:hypothetical protein GCM10027596_22360 [Nocardioides korecus]
MSAESLEAFRAFKRQQAERRTRVHRGRRSVVTLSSAVALTLVGTVAWAAWSSFGSGAGAATAATVNAATAPTVQGSSGGASISWNAVTLSNGVPVTGYKVLRHVGPTVTVACTTTEPTRSCADTSPASGSQQYGVVATRGGWSGPESPLTTFVGDTTAPTTTLSRDKAPNGAGWNKTDVVITLNATDATSGVKEIHYSVVDSTNASAETVVPVSGTSASTSFTVSREDSNRIRFWAVDNAGNVESAGDTQFVKVDKTAPVTTPQVSSSASPVNGYYTKSTTLSLSATDTSPNSPAAASGLARVEYQVGGTSGTWSTYSTPLAVNDGTTVVYYRATDNADNTGAAKSVTVKVDTAAPTTSISRVGDNTTWQKNDVAVTLNASDATSGVASLHYTVAGGPEQVVSAASASFTVSREDSNQIAFWSVDNAGNAEAMQNNTFVKLDKTAPVTTATPTSTATPSGGWYKSPVTVNLAAVDTSPLGAPALASGVTSTEYSLASSSGPWTAGTSVTVSTDGSTTVWYRSTDVAGNVAAAASQVVKIDQVAPTLATAAVTGGTAGSGGWYVGETAPVVTFTANDPLSGVASQEYQIGATSGSWTTYPAGGVPVPESSSPSGTDVYVRATDTAGNVSTITKVTVNYDKTGPSAPTVTVNPTSPDGSNGYYVNAPKVTGSGSSDSGSGIDHYEAQLNGASWTIIPSGGYVVADGSAQTVTVRAVDAAGNASTTAATSALKVDTADPAVTPSLTGGTQGTSNWYTSAPSLTVSATDATSNVGKIEWSTDGTNWTAIANGGSVPLTQGDLTYQFRARDNAGRTGTGSSQQVKLDLVDPSAPGLTVSGAAPNTNGWYTTQPRVTLSPGTDGTPTTGTASGYKGTQYQYDSTSASGWLLFASSLLVGDTSSSGTTLNWRGIDNAGRTSTVGSQAFRVDSRAPSTNVGTPFATAGANSWFTSSVSVPLNASDPTPGSGLAATTPTRYQVTNSSSAPADNTWSTAASGSAASITGDGTWYLWFRSSDAAGNVETARSSGPYKIDKTAPVVSAVRPDNATYSNGSAPWTYSECGTGYICATVAEGGSGLSSVSFVLANGASYWNGSAFVATNTPQTMVLVSTTGSSTVWRSSTQISTQPGNRSYAVTVTAVDVAGNSGTGTTSFSTK